MASVTLSKLAKKHVHSDVAALGRDVTDRLWRRSREFGNEAPAGDPYDDLLIAVTDALASLPEFRAPREALEQAEQNYRSVLESEIARWVEQHPEDDPLSVRVSELERRQIRDTKEEAEKRAKVERTRAELAVARSRAATAEARQDRHRLERNFDRLQEQYLRELQELRNLRAAIASVVVAKKKLEIEATQHAEALGRRIGGEHSSLGVARSRLWDQRRSFVDFAVETLTGSDLVGSIKVEDRVGVADTAGPRAAEALAAELGDPAPSQEVRSFAVTSDGGSDVESSNLDDGAALPYSLARDSVTGLQERVLESTIAIGRAQSRVERSYLLLALAFTLVGVSVAFVEGQFRDLAIVYTLLALAGSVSVVLTARKRVAACVEEKIDAGNRLELSEIDRHQPERRAQKMLQVHQADLRKYHSQILTQGRHVFVLGIVCLMLGFCVIAAALLLVRDSSDLSVQIVTGALGAASGVLLNFIGVVYLKMFGEIISSVGAFHTRLVATHDIYFGAFLATKIDDAEGRRAALVDLVKDVVARGEHAEARTKTNA